MAWCALAALTSTYYAILAANFHRPVSRETASAAWGRIFNTYMQHAANPLGETVHGLRFSTCLGGKGGNQAVMAARLGAPTAMVGRVGNDLYGNTIREAFEGNGVDTR